MLLRSFHQVSRRFSRNAHAGWAARMSLGPSYRSLLLLPRLPSPAPSMSAPPMTTLSAHSGGTFEAGGTGLPRGEHLEGAAVTDRRDQGPVRAWDGDSPCGTDGDDGDGQGSRFWAGAQRPPTGPSKLRLQAGKFWRFCAAETPISQKKRP